VSRCGVKWISNPMYLSLVVRFFRWITRIIVDRNVKRTQSADYFVTETEAHTTSSSLLNTDPSNLIVDLREYDVPYLMRVSIDLEIRVGAWHSITPEHGSMVCSEISLCKDMLDLCEPRILAFDIECEKSPLKFPNAQSDRIFMISYMMKDRGFLLINRCVL
jgi:DNA polymerase elongation subunit (family B)